MPQALDVVVLVGSLRSRSFNRRLAHALTDLAAPALALRIAEIGDLPYYNEDLEPEPPVSWQRLRDEVRAADAVLFVTPEYNRSMPAVLKNAVDVLSRPYGRSALAAKPAAVISASPGALGGFGANHHLRQALSPLNVHVMAAPEAYIGNVGDALDDNDRLVNTGTRELLQKFLAAFEHWIRHFVRH
jgi:chromate reductase